MSKSRYGFRTGRGPAAGGGFPLLPLVLLVLAVLAWLWALGVFDRKEEQGLPKPSITQTPAADNVTSTPGATAEKASAELPYVSLFAVQLGAYATEDSAQAALAAREAAGQPCALYRDAELFKLLDSVWLTQQEAEARQTALLGEGADSYVFLLETASLTAEVTGTPEEVEAWQNALRVLGDAGHTAALAAREDSGGAYTLFGLSEEVENAADALTEFPGEEAQALLLTLELCGQALEEALETGEEAYGLAALICTVEAADYANQALAASGA